MGNYLYIVTCVSNESVSWNIGQFVVDVDFEKGKVIIWVVNIVKKLTPLIAFDVLK